MGNVLRLGIARVGLAINQWRANRKNQKKTIVILILGLQGVGKSTIALRLWRSRKLLPDPTYVQTKGFNTFEIKRRNLTIKLNDLGGHESVRELWSHYYADAHGVIFVVDSSKPEDLPEAGEVLAEVLRDERIMRKPVLVLANKQDDPCAVSEVDLTRNMDLVTIVNSFRCLTRVDLCAANNLRMDQGIFNGFKWLVSYITTQYGEINTRVQQDSAIEHEREKTRFSLARDQARRQREEDAQELSSLNTTEPAASARSKFSEETNDLNSVNNNESGIDQIQRPALISNLVDVEPEEVEPPVAFKPKEVEIPERPSPEGAADSAEDLKYVDPKGAIEKLGENNEKSSAKEPKHPPAASTVSEKSNSSSGRPASKVTSNTSNVSVKKSSSGTKQTAGKSRQKTGTENPAFEPSEDDRESLRHQQFSAQYNNNNKHSSDYHRLMRYRANSIRSNSTETDVELPGEIIMVTTQAEVHKSHETLDDMDLNSNPKCDRTVSPTLSNISGHISHKTSLESINFSLGNEPESAINSAGTGKNRSRSSSTGRIHDRDVSAISVKMNNNSQQPSTLQKLANLKNRNKTAPLSDPRDSSSNYHHPNHHANGSAVSARATQQQQQKPAGT